MSAIDAARTLWSARELAQGESFRICRERALCFPAWNTARCRRHRENVRGSMRARLPPHGTTKKASSEVEERFESLSDSMAPLQGGGGRPYGHPAPEVQANIAVDQSIVGASSTAAGWKWPSSAPKPRRLKELILSTASRC